MLDVNPEGSVPVVKDGETDEWFTDSAKFVDYVENKQPEPALGKSSEAPEAGTQVFPKFVAAIKAPAEDKSKLEPVVEVMKIIDMLLTLTAMTRSIDLCPLVAATVNAFNQYRCTVFFALHNACVLPLQHEQHTASCHNLSNK